MAKKILGIDIGYDNLKMALVSGRTVLGTAVVPMPKNLMRDGHIVSDESMGELIRGAMKENGLRTNAAAFVIANENAYVKNVIMPQMTEDQLVYNLPFEFRDYISGEIRDYLFDYSVLQQNIPPVPKEERAGNPFSDPFGQPDIKEPDDDTPSMELMAVSVPRADMEETRAIMRRSGMKLVKAAPALCTYIQLIRIFEETHRRNPDDREEEYCILDLGYQSIRMYMFRGDRHMVTREMDTGLSRLDEVVAEIFGVDIHLAHTYIMTNFEDCRRRDECLNAYDDIAMELMRVLNFYRYSNPDSNVREVWLSGGGAMIEPLREAISLSLGMEIYPASALLPGGEDIENGDTFVQAIGAAIE